MKKLPTSPTRTDEATVDFEALLVRTADKAYNFALRLTGNDQDAQDLVQEAFRRGFEHRDRYDPTRPFSSWLYRILKNVHLDAVRRYEYKHKVALDASPNKDGEGSWADVLKGKDPEPLDTLVRSEEERQLQRALKKLPGVYRTAIVLFDIEGFSYEEIAEITECPIGTVGSRINQGRALLRKSLQKMENSKEVSTHD